MSAFVGFTLLCLRGLGLRTLGSSDPVTPREMKDESIQAPVGGPRQDGGEGRTPVQGSTVQKV